MKLFTRISGLLFIAAISLSSVFAQVAIPQPKPIPTDVKGLIAAIKEPKDQSVYQCIYALVALNDPEGNATLVAQLKESKSPQVKQVVAYSLGMLKNDEKVVDALIGALKDTEPNVRTGAVQSLCVIANPRSLPMVLAAINTEQDQRIKSRLYFNVASFGAIAVDPLLELLKTADPATKPRIIQALAQTRDERVVEPLLDAFNNETDVNAKSRLINSMSIFISNKHVMDTLMEAVKNKDMQISKTAISVVANQNDPTTIAPLLNAYPNVSPESKVVMLEAITRMPDPRFATCILGLKDAAENVRVQAATTLGLLQNERAVEPLKNLLEKDASKNVKSAAAYSLAQLDADGIADILMGMINDTDVVMRERTIRALALIGEKRAVPQITKLLVDPEPRIKNAAYAAFGTMKMPESVKPVGETMKTADMQTKILAARTIGQIGDAKGTEYLLPLLNEQDYNLRNVAIRSLGEIKSTESTPILVTLLDEKNEDPKQQYMVNNLKNNVLNALGNIADPATVAVLLDNAIVKETSNAAINALRVMGKVAAPALVEALGGDNLEKKQVAISAIGNTASQDAVPLLQKVADDKANLLTAIKAVRALGELRNNGANVADLDKYLEMLSDGAKSAEPIMANESFNAIGTIKSDKAVATLSALKIAKPQLSQQVYQTLGTIATPTAVNVLIAMKNETQDVQVKNQIISILGRTGDANAIPSLTEDLKNPLLKTNAQQAIKVLSGEADPNSKSDGVINSGPRTGRGNMGGRNNGFGDPTMGPGGAVTFQGGTAVWGQGGVKTPKNIRGIATD